MMGSRKRAKGAPTVLEVWTEWETQVKVLKVGLIVCSVAMVLLGFLCNSLADRPVYVVRVNPDGRSYLVTDVNDGQLPTHQEVKAVAQEFLDAYMGFDSLQTEQKLRHALSVMTTRLFEQHRKTYQGTDLSAHIRSLGVKTRFDVEDCRVVESSETSFGVEITGRVLSQRMDARGAPAAEMERRFEAKLRLLRVERTKRLPSGLLIDAFAYHLLTEDPSGGIQES